MLPVGCLGLILIVVAFICGIFFVVMSAMKSSDVYRYALEKAKAEPEVVAEMGEPIQDGWFVQGSVSTSNGNGQAKFQIPITGPKKSGTIYVEASKDPVANSSSDWNYTTLEVRVEGRPERIIISGLDSSALEPIEAGDSGETDETEPPILGESNATPQRLSGKTISGGVLNGKAISKPAPPYPAIAKAAKAQGTVTVQVMVDESGDVVSARAVSGHPLLQNAAVQAARQAKFSPTKLSGVAVKVSGVLTYNFVLE